MQEAAGVLKIIADVLTQGGPLVGLLGGLGGLASLLLTERRKAKNQRDLERLKAELARDTELLHSQLSAAAFERQTRFARLHERRVDVVAQLYRVLVTAERAFHSAMAPYRAGRSEEANRIEHEEDVRKAVEAGNAFVEYFQTNRVWLDEDLCRSVETLAVVFRDAWAQYIDPDEERGRARERGDAWRRVINEVPKIRAEIENAMRVMLGVLTPPS